jgi:nucleoside-diphosphate-sugar epimerase
MHHSLTILTTGRNDNYDGNFNERLIIAMSQNMQRLPECKFVFVEWNPDPRNPLVCEDLQKAFGNKVKYYVVHPNFHSTYCTFDSFNEYPAKNVAIRRADTDFILSINSDVIISPDVAEKLKGPLKRNTIYRAVRLDIRPDYLQVKFPLLPKFIVGENKGSTNACGDFLLLDRDSWHYSTGYMETIPSQRLHKDSEFVHRISEIGRRPIEFLGYITHWRHKSSWSNSNQNRPNVGNINWDFKKINFQKNSENWGLAHANEENSNGITWLIPNEKETIIEVAMKPKSLKTALVLGGHGFIGHYLARDLKEQGFWVRTVDIKDFPYNDSFKNEMDDYIVGDLRDINVCNSVFRGLSGKPFDEVYQLAACMGGAGFIFTGDNDAKVLHDSMLINVNASELAYKTGVGKLFFSSSACFIAGTLVYTKEGFLPIEKITMGTRVMAEDGNWHEVLNRTERNYEGNLCKISGLGAHPIICTPDHRFLTEDNNWVEAKNLDGLYMSELKPNMESDENEIILEDDKYVEMFKELKNFNDPLYLLAEKYGTGPGVPYNWARQNKYPERVDPVTKNCIKKDYNLGLLIGIVLSEGWYEKNGNSERIVCCFGKHETDLIKEYEILLQKVFGIYPEKIINYNTRTAVKIHISSKRMIYVLNKLCNFKDGSHNKSLTQFGMTGPEDYRKGILDGANKGDGSEQYIALGNYYRHLWTTTSDVLAMQYSLLLKSFGIKNSISVNNEKSWQIEGRQGITKKLYQIYSKRKNTQIQSIIILPNQKTKVYNLEIKEVHSYIVEGLIAHNCVYNQLNQESTENPNTSESSAYPAYPDSVYGFEKLISEQLYQSYQKNHGLKIRIARFHNIFGPEGAWNNGREKSPAAICRKIAQAKNGDTIELWGDGNQTRSYLFISECLIGIRKLMDSEFSGPLNIGSNEMVSINRLTEIVKEIANKPKIRIQHIPGPLGVRGRTSDNRLIKEKLGWVPNYPLTIGLRKTYDWINEQVIQNKKDFSWTS